MAQHGGASSSGSNSQRDVVTLDDALKPKHKVFLSHSGFQKGFVEHLCVELEGRYRFPFFDKHRGSLPIGENFPQHIFEAIHQCHVGVVILSEEFFTSKWPMMELAAMHNRVLNEVEEGKSTFKIIPIFLRISLEEFDDLGNRSRWLSRWHEFAVENVERVKVEKWKAALNYLRAINGLVYNGSGEVRFQKEIVDEICKIVPPEIKLDDSHIQGRSRLCKVIREKIDALQKDKSHEVCVLGLYGVGGIGKTSICKALCNDFFAEFRGRICYAELEKGSEEDLLQGVLKSLTNIRQEHLDGLNLDQLRHVLKEGAIKDAIFLALDNMSDSDASINQVKTYLSGSFPTGSIVIVTTRSKSSLLLVKPYIDENKCLEMPELMLEEAKCLFAKSSDLELRNEVDDQLVLRCVKRCYFQKDGGKSGHYHPLALDVLGRQFARLSDVKEWTVLLDTIDEDIFNPSRDNNHPIFSILRKSFDTLSPEDQLVFMDVALFLPHQKRDDGWNVSQCGWSVFECGWSVFAWLGMMNKIPRVGDVMRALERLKMKSLLESVGDGSETIGMHDLWRAFCVAETRFGELRWRRWMYEAGSFRNELVETRPSGTCWENVKRMSFSHDDFIFLKKVNFAHFSNVTVLKISGLTISKKLMVDFSGLIHLKSLEIIGKDLNDLVIQDLPRDLIFLNFNADFCYKQEFPSQLLTEQVACLQELQCLLLMGYGGGKLPDMTSMISLHVAIFYKCFNVVTVTGLSSRLTNLRVLSLRGCLQLRDCLGVGDLVALEELNCRDCVRLQGLPNLRKLRLLRMLNIFGCVLITELPGLGDVVALEELDAGLSPWHKPSTMLTLPDLSKLRNLRVLHLDGRPLDAVPGFDHLVSLQNVVADFRAVTEWPSLRHLLKLQELKIMGWSMAGLRGLEYLAVLQTLHFVDCIGVDELPDFRGLISLRTLSIENCAFKDVSCLRDLSMLESLLIKGCSKLERLPDLQTLGSLTSFEVISCDMLKGWDNNSTLGQVVESSCRPPERLDYAQKFTGLQTLKFSDCLNFMDLMSIGAFSRLMSLDIGFMPVRELPNLSSFPHLNTLRLLDCKCLQRLTISEPVNSLTVLSVERCRSFATLPDLCSFPGLVRLELWECGRATTLLNCSVPLPALRWLKLIHCRGVKALPDLAMFPALEDLMLIGCSELLTLRLSSGPLPTLQWLTLDGCSGIMVLPDLGMFPGLTRLYINGCSFLSTLRSSGSFLALQHLEARECRSLSLDELDQLRLLWPQCQIDYGPLDDEEVAE